MDTQEFIELGKGIYGKIITVTPEMAKEMLSHSTQSRPIKKDKVQQYAADMKAGKWLFNGSSISFSDKGNLLDGKMRLLALIESNTSQDILIFKGFNENIIATIDLGHHGKVRKTGR